MEYTRWIQRHSKQTRFTHAVLAISCVWLCISGLFVFVPTLSAMNPALTQAFRISHRVVALFFIFVPILSGITAPKGFKHFCHKYTKKWTADDKKWLMMFVPYMLNAKKTHMPDQDETKSGQIFSDGMIVIICVWMAVTGALLWILPVMGVSAGLDIVRLLHDLGFIMTIVMGVAHIFVAGIFQPYGWGMARIMWYDGQIREVDAMYHWGYWTREQIAAAGDNILLKDKDGNIVARGHDAVYGPLAPKPIASKEEAAAILEAEKAEEGAEPATA